MHRYCFVLSWPFELTGGVNQVVRNLIQEFQSHDRYACKPVALELSWPRKQNDLFDSGVPRTYLRLRSPYTAARPIYSAIAFLLHLPGDLMLLRRLCREQRIRVLNMHFLGPEALNLVLLKSLGLFDGLVVLSMHGSDIRQGIQQTGFSRRLWRFVLRHASVVVACSDGLRQEALQFEPRANAITIYNGIDVERFSAHSDPEFHWPPELNGKRVIVNVGQFEFRKGHDVLLKAFKRVTSVYKDAALLLVGFPGPTSGAIRSLVEDLGLAGSVVIMERVPHEQIYDLLKHATLFALATRWETGSMGEGFAIAILEAAAAKLPVVSTASCGVEEIIRDGETGRVVPLEDDAALAAAISEMLEHPDSARLMAENLYAVVRARFTWQRAAEQYASLAV